MPTKYKKRYRILKQKMPNKNLGWIGVDLDGTLAEHHSGPFCFDRIGPPIEKMLNRVKGWLARGVEVRIVTARYASHGTKDPKTHKPIDAVTPIEEWCLEHIGEVLEVTNEKDMQMISLWDDRAVQVIANTGLTMEEYLAKK